MAEEGFVVNTKGCCVLCLKDCSEANHQDAISKEITLSAFQLMLRYLRIDYMKLGNISASLQRFMANERHFAVGVSHICEDCSTEMRKFGEAYAIHMETMAKMGESLQVLHDFIEHGLRSGERQRNFQAKMKRDGTFADCIGATIAENLRTEAKNRCLETVADVKTRVSRFQNRMSSRTVLTKEEWNDETINDTTAGTSFASSQEASFPGTPAGTSGTTQNHLLSQSLESHSSKLEVNELMDVVETDGSPSSSNQQHVTGNEGAGEFGGEDEGEQEVGAAVQSINNQPNTGNPLVFIECRYCEPDLNGEQPTFEQRSLNSHLLQDHPFQAFASKLPPSETPVSETHFNRILQKIQASCRNTVACRYCSKRYKSVGVAEKYLYQHVVGSHLAQIYAGLQATKPRVGTTLKSKGTTGGGTGASLLRSNQSSSNSSGSSVTRSNKNCWSSKLFP